jgi:protein O-mannosyl-transferase
MSKPMARSVGPTGSFAAFFPALLVGVTAVVYANTFSAPFIFDEIAAITQNPSIHGWRSAFSPPDGLSVTGRPLVNLSLAFSSALSGETSWGYHAINLLIHLLATLTLFDLVRRTLLRPRFRDRFVEAAPALAFFTALLWAVHPLQTAAVTYVMQRTESLMALCYLLTLYGFIRSSGSREPAGDGPTASSVMKIPKAITRKVRTDSGWIWKVFAVLSCLAGMASKEVMVTAPLMVFLYDRIFVSGNFRQAWRRNRVFYVSLAATWSLLGFLVLGTENRGASAGFGASVPWTSYALTQLFAVPHYLRLALWPHPLVFDYGAVLLTSPREIWFPALVTLSLLAGTLLALRRWPAIGFCGTFLWVVLAPTSSVVPIATQTIAEHRLYLPLAAVIAAVVTALYARLGRWSMAIFGVATLVLGTLTIARNTDYRSMRSLWEDTVTKSPHNPRAHYNLGVALALAGDRPAAINQFEAAVRLQPDHVEALTKLGESLLESGQPAAALARFTTALVREPQSASAHDGAGRALIALDRLPEAVPHFVQAARAQPASGISHLNLGNALLQLGRIDEASAELEIARRLLPSSGAVLFSLGNVAVHLGRFAEAVTHYAAAARLVPDDPAIHYNLGNALAQLGRYDEALAHFEQAARLAPDDVATRNNLARLRAYLRK